jgi:hypothetical protein
VSQVIVGRLKECIPTLVSPFQTSFVPGRNIHENIVVAQEMVHRVMKMKGTRNILLSKWILQKNMIKLVGILYGGCLWRLIFQFN